MKNGFFFYENFKTTADSLPDEMRLKFYDALTNYAINGVEPEDGILKALITAFKPSINKIEKRGGNNNPTGQNQYSKVKSGQKEVKVGQSGQSFNKQETGNIKEKINKKEKNYDAEFEEWWKICPKKVEKDKAFNKFKSILAEKKATVDELMDGMNRYLQKCIRDNTEDHYIKHPTTWLNGGCWKDDYNAWKNIDDKVPKSGGIGEWDKTPETYTVGDY